MPRVDVWSRAAPITRYIYGRWPRDDASRPRGNQRCRLSAHRLVLTADGLRSFNLLTESPYGTRTLAVPNLGLLSASLNPLQLKAKVGHEVQRRLFARLGRHSPWPASTAACAGGTWPHKLYSLPNGNRHAAWSVWCGAALAERWPLVGQTITSTCGNRTKASCFNTWDCKKKLTSPWPSIARRNVWPQQAKRTLSVCGTVQVV